MAGLPKQIQSLVEELKKLPGIGTRSAERIALYLVQKPSEVGKNLAAAIITAIDNVRPCAICGALAEKSPCAICTDPSRDPTLLCVVEQPVDILKIEKAGVFRGKYHVLGGKISPVNRITADQLRIDVLQQRLKTEPIKEIILALSTDVEGEATCVYLSKHLARPDLKISRIAYGLPAGAGLEFADEFTIGQAIEWRRQMQ